MAAVEARPRRVFGWDWSQTTHRHGPDAVPVLLEAMGAAIVTLRAPGAQGWRHTVTAYDGDGYRLGRVLFGGSRGDVHVTSTSAAADRVRPAVVGLGEAKTSRVDTRVDTLMRFEDLDALCVEVASGYGSRITRMSSEVRGESMGRTVYVGSPSSDVRVRVYEKWLQSPGQYEEGTNRVEVQLRPRSRVKGIVSGWEPIETFCASRVTRALADALAEELVPTRTLHISRGTPDLEHTIEAMGKQYRRAVGEYMLYSGGDVGRVLDHLGVHAAAPADWSEQAWDRAFSDPEPPEDPGLWGSPGDSAPDPAWALAE